VERGGDTPEEELPAKERARVRHRDRKRETRMVVDNAAVRRVLPAIRRRMQRQGDRGDGDATP